MAISSPKCAHRDVGYPNPQLMVVGPQINLQIHCRILNSVRLIVNPRHGVMVACCLLIQLFIANTHVDSIILINKETRSSRRCYTWTKEPLTQ